jgi:hypothetical protein
MLWRKAYSREVTTKERELALTVAKKSGLSPVIWAVFNSSEFLDLK